MGGNGWIWDVGNKGSIMISNKNVGGHAEGCTTERREVVIPKYLTMMMDSDCNEVSGGNLVMRGV